MPNVSETRIAVNLHDGASTGLQHLNSQYSRFSNTIQNSGSRLAQFNRQVAGANLGGFASNADRAASSLSNMNKTLERLIYSASRYLVIYKALAGLGNVWDTVVGGSYEYAKSLETNQIGIAGILKSMVTLNGEAIKWNDAMALSGKAMKSLQSEALRTAATSKELIETFRALLGPGLSSGMTIDQIVNLSTVGTNAVRSLGLPTNQYVQELRSIITEGIRPASSTLATSLGITNKDIKEAKKSAEGLYNFLMKRMEGFQDAVKYTSDTVEGRIARIEEGLNVGIAKGSASLYSAYSRVLEKIATALIPIPKNLGEHWEINPTFIKNVETVADKINSIAITVTDIGAKGVPALGVAFRSVFSILDRIGSVFGRDDLNVLFGAIAVKKLAPYIADIGNIATQSRTAYEAQTSLGRAIQGVSDKLSGRAVKLKQLAVEQANYNAFIETFIGNISYLDSLHGMINSNANSVTRLAEKWQQMGMSAEQAASIQNQVLAGVASGNTKAAQSWIKHGDAIAENIQKTNRYEASVKSAFDTELRELDRTIAAQNTKKNTSKEIVEAFLAETEAQNRNLQQTINYGKEAEAIYRKELAALDAISIKKKSAYTRNANDLFREFHGTKGVTSEQEGAVTKLIEKLRQLGLEEEKVVTLTEKFITKLQKGGQDAHALADAYISSMQSVVEKQQEITAKEETARAEAERTNQVRIESTQRLIEKLQELGLEEEKVYTLADRYVKALERGGIANAESLSNQILLTGQNILAKERSVALDQKQIELSSEQVLLVSARANAERQGGQVAVEALEKIIAKHDNLIQKMREQGLAIEEVQREWLTFLDSVSQAVGKETLVIMENEAATKTWGDTAEIATDRAGMMLSKIGSLSMSFGILCDVLAQADEENKEWYQSAADAALTAGMFAMAIGSIVTELGPLLAKLPAAIKLLRDFSIAKAAAGFGGIAAAGIAAGAVAVAGAAVYSGYRQYQAYENNEEISATDDWTGEEVTLKKSPMRDIDDADSYAIINDSNYNYGTATPEPVVGLMPGIGSAGGGSGGGGRKSKGGGGDRKANKKAESEERIKRILEEINRELLTMDDRATAYEKTMADARVKIAKYEEDITKAKLRGVDVSKVQSKLDELRVAYTKKATEAQQDENLKRMKQEEESSERFYEMGLNTIEQKRTILTRQLEEHKQYLEDLLREEQMSVDRRMNLEAQLAETVKKIHQNAAYDAKQGWILGLREIANEQTNYKDLTTNLFQTFESGFTNLIVSGGKVKDFLSSFFKSIIQSLVQVIIKQMLSYALMRAMGGGGNVIHTSSGWEQHFSNGTIVSNTPHFTHASGGGVTTGNTYLVGENGPELLRLYGSSGTVYSNNRTKEMVNEPPVVNIEIVNNTGSPMKAREENTFDGMRQLKKIIIDTASSAAYTNEGGFRDAIQGAAAARG